MAFKLSKFLAGAGQGALGGLQAEHQNKLNMERDEKFAKQKEEIIAARNAKLAEIGTAKQREFDSFVSTAGLSEEEKAKAARIELGIDPRAQGSSAMTIANMGLTDRVAGSQEVIKKGEERGKETGKTEGLRDSGRAEVQGEIKKQESLGSAKGGKAVEYLSLADTWDINREFLVESIPELKSAFSDAPGSSVSKGVQTVLGKAIGNSTGADAQAVVDQYAAIFLQGMPFPPGAQSDKEMQARAQVLSDQLANPNVTVDTKVKILGNFVEWQDTKAKNYRKKANDLLGVDADTSSSDFSIGGDTGAQSGSIPTPQTQADFDALPSGSLYIDPEDGKQYRKP